MFLVVERPCGETMYSGDHRKGLGLLATIFVLLVPMQQLCEVFGPDTTAVPILPQPTVTGYYWPPGHETFTFRPFTEETHRTQRESATFRLARVCVYYCRTFYKAVRVGEEESGGHVL